MTTAASPAPEPAVGLAVVVLNWNCARETAAAVRTLPDSWHARVIVVDNGSDRELDALAEIESWPHVTVVRRASNGGYAAGMNTGIDEARRRGFTHAALVNADARPDAATLVALSRLAAGSAVVGTAQRDASSRYVTAARGGVFARELDCPGCDAGDHEVDVVTGATILLDLATAGRLGGFDESFFHYAEEVDYCLRVRRDGGRIRWSCTTVVPHAVGGSIAHGSASAHYYTARNKVLLARKHGVAVSAPRLLKDEATFALRAARDRHLGAWATGLLDGVRGVDGARAR